MLQVSVGKRLYFRLGIVQEHADRKDRIKLKTLSKICIFEYLFIKCRQYSIYRFFKIMLADIIKRLAHEGMVIDVLKLSITSHIPQVSYEKEILEHILNKGIVYYYPLKITGYIFCLLFHQVSFDASVNSYWKYTSLLNTDFTLVMQTTQTYFVCLMNCTKTVTNSFKFPSFRILHQFLAK